MRQLIILMEFFMNKRFTFFIVFMVLAVFFISCTAKEEKDSEKDMQEIEDEILSAVEEAVMFDFVLESGIVLSGTSETSRILINSSELESGSGQREVVLNLEENTPVINADSGIPAKKSEIKIGEEIYAWVSPAYTSSLPPQTAAKVIFVNVKDKNILPKYIEAVNISKSETGSVLKDLTGSEWLLDNNVKVVMYASEEKADIGDLTDGARILLWKSEEKPSVENKAAVSKILIIEK